MCIRRARQLWHTGSSGRWSVHQNHRRRVSQQSPDVMRGSGRRRRLWLDLLRSRYVTDSSIFVSSECICTGAFTPIFVNPFSDLDLDTQASSSRLESTEHAGSSQTKESSSSRRHRSQSEHKEHRDRSSIDTPAGMPVNGSVNGGARVERRPSTLARPTSELTSAADLNAVRAKDVWEMERLWKGQSMAYGLDGPQLVYAQSIGERSSASVNGDLQRANTMSGAVHGSSHTSYKLQSPFLSPSPTSSQPYSPIPAPPPPIIYSSTNASGSSPSYIYPNDVRSYPDISTIPSMSSPEPSPPRRAFTNPLPEPPRESPYRPPPLPSSVDDHESASVAEYWNKYAMATSY